MSTSSQISWWRRVGATAGFLVPLAAAAQTPPKDCLLLNRRVIWQGDSITRDGASVAFVDCFLSQLFSHTAGV